MATMLHLAFAVVLVALVCSSSSPSSSSSSSSWFVRCQYAMPGSPSADWYEQHKNAPANPYDTYINASAADEDLNAFDSFVTHEEATVLFLRQSIFTVGNRLQGRAYRRFDVNGHGSFWNVVSGIETVVIDLSPLHPTYNGAITKEQMKARGIELNANGTVSYNLTFANQHDGVDIMHNHGQLGAWWSDGVPYLTANPINSGEEQTYTYTIDPRTNSGTYFLHSHYGFNNVQGMSVPLIIQYPVDEKYPLATQLNDPNITEVLLYLEDFCLVYTNADDAETDDDDDKTFYSVTDPFICENPQLAMRAVYGEWNSQKGSMMLGVNGTMQQCPAPSLAPEFGFSYIFANDRSYDEAVHVSALPGASIRLRIINGGRMTNFLVELPDALNESVVVAVDGHYVEPVRLTSFVTGGAFSNTTVWVGVAQRVDVFVKLPMQPAQFPIVAFQEAPRSGECGGTGCRKYEVSMTAGIIIDTTTSSTNTNSGGAAAGGGDDDDDDGPTASPTSAPSSSITSSCVILPRSVPGVGMLSRHPEFLFNQNLAFTPWQTEILNSAPIRDLSWTRDYRRSATHSFVLPLSGYNGIYGLNFLPYYQFPPMIPLTTPQLLQPAAVANQAVPPPFSVRYGDRVCITFVNYNWDSHPMHLHGHSFQVVEVNGVWVNGPVRDTVMVPAGNCNNVTICFNANSESGGVHGLHCHMAIHEMAGMFTAIEYAGYLPITTAQPTTTTIAAASAAVVAQGSCNTVELVSFKSVAGVFIGLFVFSVVINFGLAYKLRQHIYHPASGVAI